MKGRVGILVLVSVVLMNVLVHQVVCRWDMTDDKRYTISQHTKELLKELDSPLMVSVLLEGELNAGFTRLQKATSELLSEFSVYTAEHIGSRPLDASLIQGLDPIVIHERTHKGKMAQTTVYPYALVEYKGKKRVVNLLQNQRGLSGEENLNNSIENLEYILVDAIRGLAQTQVEKFVFLREILYSK